MTYDALLALHGWGRDDFAHATADFLAAARFALFAERVGPMLEKTEQVRDMEVTRDMTPSSQRAVMKAKAEATEAIDAMRAALYPEDDDDG